MQHLNHSQFFFRLMESLVFFFNDFFISIFQIKSIMPCYLHYLLLHHLHHQQHMKRHLPGGNLILKRHRALH